MARARTLRVTTWRQLIRSLRAVSSGGQSSRNIRRESGSSASLAYSARMVLRSGGSACVPVAGDVNAAIISCWKAACASGNSNRVGPLYSPATTGRS